MAKYLISCCNTGRLLSEFGLVIFDALNKINPFFYLNISETKLDFATITGFTGICQIPGGYVVGTQSNPSGLLILDSDLRFVRYMELSQNFDVHSMLMHESKLLVAATAVNQILAIDLNSGSESVFWDAKNERKLHINTFIFHQQNLLVLSHQDPTHSNESVRVGVVRDVDLNRNLAQGLWHPHDLFIRPDGSIVVLSSERGWVHALDPVDFTLTKEKVLKGYIRGYHEDEEGVIVGLSAIRMFSRKQGSDKRYYRGSFEEYYQDPMFQACVARYDRGATDVEYLPFSHMNFEIYEIKRLADVSEPLLVPMPVIRRHMILRWLLSGG